MTEKECRGKTVGRGRNAGFCCGFVVLPLHRVVPLQKTFEFFSNNAFKNKILSHQRNYKPNRSVKSLNENAVHESSLEINEEKVNNLIRRILIAESKNMNSQAITDIQMVNKIKAMIEEEIQCY
ncbi:MAG: hypothetical protein IKH71_08890 [Oscillospiraceae bacterium]|nr:hypothetical protein [Oscillospiraceae bacterium]